MTEPSSSDRLSFTLFLAIALHAAIIIGVGFKIDKSDKVAPSLNITLATHASTKAPEEADFLAQNNQEGSGTEDAPKELTTTELAKVADTQINEVNPVPVQSAKAVVQNNEQKVLSTSVKSHQKTPQKTKPNETVEQKEGSDTTDNNIERNKKLASLQAKLAQDKQAYARIPRITRHTSVSAKSSDEAAYYNYWSDRIVQVGNKNFPQEALDQEIFGNLRLEVGVQADGRVTFINVTNSSGHSILDAAARKIVKLAAPFKPLPSAVQKNTDIFVIYRTWNFDITGLSTSD